MNPKAASIEEYFSWLSEEQKAKLQTIREILRQAIPEAKEVISYHMPAFKTSEVLVYYAAAKNHIGYYPTASGVSEFKKELEGFVTSKGAIQIPYDKTLPVKLIADIAKFRAAEAEERLKAKQKKK